MSRGRPRRGSSSSVSVAGPFNVREVLFVRLCVETAKYLEMKAIPFGEKVSGREKVQRGILRGMALCMTKSYGNGYEPYWTQETKACEKRAGTIAKEWISDGKPEGDRWWIERADRFWRSASDLGPARV